MRGWIALALGAAAAFSAVFAVIAPAGHPVALDLDIATTIAAHRGDALTTVARGASAFGSVLGIVPTALVVGAWLYRRSGWIAVRWLAATVVGATALYLSLNYAITRPRPPLGMRLFEDTEWSLPSGHSTQAVAFWFMTAILVTIGQPRRVRALAVVVALAIVLTIGGSRIYLCQHWTTDVLGGFALGTCWLATLLALRARKML